ncbi:hypothetical protein WA026_014890 [Henosepilachna vigintioctopunctata]|uniref:Protein aurora borealis n=1 Tax=Henosepilachna vigintioctopunctata TaxID=420089 RepID=A0AAW1UZ07_9CUCU
MEFIKSDGKNMTPSKRAKRLVEKVINGNSNCDSSPFRLLPSFSTPPSRMLKIKNPFDSPLRDRLHLPICSPGPFLKSTPNKEEKFKWSICDISHLKPAEIETNSIDQHVNSFDPFVESQIQERISSFFSEHSVVPSPLGQEMKVQFECKESSNHKNVNNASTQTKLSLGSVLPRQIEKLLKSYETLPEVDECSSEDEIDAFEGDNQYLSEEVYYKKLFDFDNDSSLSSPPRSTGDSPLQFSPLKEIEVCPEPSFSEHLDRRELNECGLSPITPEAETSLKGHSSFMSVRESRSACRLIFSENMSIDQTDNIVPDVLDPVSSHGNSFEDTMRKSPLPTPKTSNDIWDMEFKNYSLTTPHVYEESKMDISFPPTPNTGLFTSQRKRLSDSFGDLNDLLGNCKESNILGKPNTSKATSSSEVFSDTGYHSSSGVVLPSLTENIWNNSHLIASTPTKRKL